MTDIFLDDSLHQRYIIREILTLTTRCLLWYLTIPLGNLKHGMTLKMAPGKLRSFQIPQILETTHVSWYRRRRSWYNLAILVRLVGPRITKKRLYVHVAFFLALTAVFLLC